MIAYIHLNKIHIGASSVFGFADISLDDSSDELLYQFQQSYAIAGFYKLYRTGLAIILGFSSVYINYQNICL